MSGVDVVAAFDRIMGCALDLRIPSETDMSRALEARAAVAELIEAAAAEHEQFVALVKLHGEHSCYAIQERMTAALAKVQP